MSIVSDFHAALGQYRNPADGVQINHSGTTFLQDGLRSCCFCHSAKAAFKACFELITTTLKALAKSDQRIVLFDVHLRLSVHTPTLELR